MMKGSKINQSADQLDQYLTENSKIVRQWPQWMKDGAQMILGDDASSLRPRPIQRANKARAVSAGE